MNVLTPGKKNLITDVKGLYIGNSENELINTGSTILTCKDRFVASYKVLGGAPGTRETDLLEPDKLVEKIDALVLSGGSAFGLEAASETVNLLRRDNKGYSVSNNKVPIVPSAIIFDLMNGGNKDWENNPYIDLAQKAYSDMSSNFKIGSYGAGKGATAGNIKGGLGSCSLLINNTYTVGALIIVNSFGSVVVNDAPHFWAAPFEYQNEFGGLGCSNKFEPFKEIARTSPDDFKKNTVIGVVATDADLSKAQCKALATVAHDGITRAVFPSHTTFDGDLMFAISTGEKQLKENFNDILAINQAASLCVSRSIARGVYHASNSKSDIFPSFKNKFKIKVS